MEEKLVRKDLYAIIARNNLAFLQKLLAYALALEKRMQK